MNRDDFKDHYGVEQETWLGDRSSEMFLVSLFSFILSSLTIGVTILSNACTSIYYFTRFWTLTLVPSGGLIELDIDGIMAGLIGKPSFGF